MSYKVGVNDTAHEGVLRRGLQSVTIKDFLSALEALNRHKKDHNEPAWPLRRAIQIRYQIQTQVYTSPATGQTKLTGAAPPREQMKDSR